MAIPIYLFTGFLESGKTTFLQETLEDPDFCTGEKTLLLLCEEGEIELEPKKFAGGNVTIVPVENEQDLTREFLESQTKQRRIDRVIIEYNGMWNLQTLYDALPKGWEFYQILLTADSTTFPSYMNNMRQLAVDKLQDPEVVIFNRCTDKTDRTYLHRAVRMVNRRAQIIYEYTDGSIRPDDIEDELPFDLKAPVIELRDEDFGIWYLDAMENPDKYRGKHIHFKAYVCQTKRAPKGCFVAGRFGMTCCAEDISFIGVLCEADNAAQLRHRSWVDVTAELDVNRHEIYGGEGPWLRASQVTPTTPPQDELVYFLR